VSSIHLLGPSTSHIVLSISRVPSSISHLGPSLTPCHCACLSLRRAGKHCLRNVRPPHSRLRDGRSDCSSQCADITRPHRTTTLLSAHTANRQLQTSLYDDGTVHAVKMAINLHNGSLLSSKNGKLHLIVQLGIVTWVTIRECNSPLGMWLLAACASPPARLANHPRFTEPLTF